MIMIWAREGGYVVLTSDRDFCALLATSSAGGLEGRRPHRAVG